MHIRFIVLILLLTAASAAVSGEAPETPSVEITMLYDAFGKHPTLEKDWGFAAYIEAGGKRILFDTGNDPAIFARNAKAAGVDLTALDFAVISHRHGDHAGGLTHLAEVAPDLVIYAPQENFGVFGAELPGSFYQREPSLPKEMRYFDGRQRERLRFGSAWPEASFVWVEETTEIEPGFHLIALRGGWGVDFELREVSLAIETPEGVVLIVGCSHPTLERIVEAAAEATGQPIELVLGGTHLLPALPGEIERVGLRLRDDLEVNRLAPAHCTGERGFSMLKAIFGDRYVYAGLGETVSVGPADQD